MSGVAVGVVCGVVATALTDVVRRPRGDAAWGWCAAGAWLVVTGGAEVAFVIGSAPLVAWWALGVALVVATVVAVRAVSRWFGRAGSSAGVPGGGMS